jgi:hypothetical protein
MAVYTAQDKNGMTVDFMWDGKEPPTDADMDGIFAAARAGKSTGEYNPGQADPLSNPPMNKKDIVAGDLPSFLGGIAGGLAPTLRQRVPAAGILAGGGEAFHQLYQRATGDPNTPQTSEEAARRIAELGGGQAVGQLAGEGITMGISKLLPHVKESMMVRDRTGSEDTLRQFMEPYLNKGLSERMADKAYQFLPESLQYERYAKPGFTIAQKSDPLSGAHRMEQIVESSFFGAKPIKEFKKAQQSALEDWSKSISNQMWQGMEKLPPEQRGQAFVEAFNKAEDMFRQGAKSRYAEVDKVLGSESIDISGIKTAAMELAQKNAQFKGIGSSESGDTLIKQIADLPDQMTFADASELRSRLLKVAKASRGDVGGKNAYDFVGQVDKAMESTAGNLSEDAKKVWREANSFYKEGKQTFDNSFIEGLVKKGKDQPELVGKALFQNGEITQIKMAKDILKDDPKTFQAMKAGWLEDVFTKTKKSDGSLVGNAFFSQLKGMGDETLKEIFTGPELALIRKFEEASTKTQKLGSAGGGSILVQLMQAGALGGILSGTYFREPEMLAGGLAILAAPRVLGNMLVNPKYHHLFYNGLSTEKPLWMPALSKLAAEAYKVEKQLSEQKKAQP